MSASDTIQVAIKTATAVLAMTETALTRSDVAASLHVGNDIIKNLNKNAIKPLKDVALSFTDSFDQAYSDQTFDAITDQTLDPSFPGQAANTQVFNVGFPPEMEVTKDSQGNAKVTPKKTRAPAPAEQQDECARQPFIGVLGGAAFAVGETLGGVAGALSNNALGTLSAVGSVFNAVPDVLMGFSAQAAESLLDSIVNEGIFMAQIIVAMEEVVELMPKIKPAVYASNHAIIVRRAKQYLQLTDKILAGEEALVTARGTPQTREELAQGQQLSDAVFRLQAQTGTLSDPNGLPDAQKLMKLAEDLLCGKDVFPDTTGPSTGGVTSRIVALLAEIIGIKKLLGKSLELTKGITNNLNNVNLDLQTNFSATNYFGGTIHKIRCEIRKILNEMDGALEANDLRKYIYKEKEWCLKVKVLETFIQFVLKAPANTITDLLNSELGQGVTLALQLIGDAAAGKYVAGTLTLDPDRIVLATDTVPVGATGVLFIKNLPSQKALYAKVKYVGIPSVNPGADLSSSLILPVETRIFDPKTGELLRVVVTQELVGVDLESAGTTDTLQLHPLKDDDDNEIFSFLPALLPGITDGSILAKVSGNPVEETTFCAIVEEFVAEGTRIIQDPAVGQAKLEALVSLAKDQVALLNARESPIKAFLTDVIQVPGMPTATGLSVGVSSGVKDIRALSGVTASLAALDWSKVFSTDTITTSLNGLAAVQVARAKQVLEDAPDVVPGVKSTRDAAVSLLDGLSDTFIDKAREEGIEDDIEGGFVNQEQAEVVSASKDIRDSVTRLNSVSSLFTF